ncbi:hypothetical protein [Saccharothrix sp. ST-888]|uniref:hypothetical protein n=1 Tax=Saccharothrix sp. ST-888 TaxID=1427391 RepID=UPI0012E03D58|nr:hypothetical protein [Saccharothrix sp. ST-888]
MTLDSHSPTPRLWLRAAGWALQLCVASVAAETTAGMLYDHYVREPTRRCHRVGAVPPPAIGLGVLAVLIGLVAAVWLVRLLATSPRTGGGLVRAVQVGLVVLLAFVAILLAVEALSLWADLDPPELDPFNCGE